MWVFVRVVWLVGAVDTGGVKKRWGWGLSVAGLVILGGSIWGFVALGLDKSDKLASVLSLFVGVLALGVAVYGVVLARHGDSDQAAVSVGGSMVGGSVRAVADVSGPVVIRRRAPRKQPQRPPHARRAGASGPQTQANVSAADSAVAGSVEDIRRVGGL